MFRRKLIVIACLCLLILRIPVTMIFFKFSQFDSQQNTESNVILEENDQVIYQYNGSLLDKLNVALNWVYNNSIIPNSMLNISGFRSFIDFDHIPLDSSYYSSSLNKHYVLIELRNKTSPNPAKLENSGDNAFKLKFLKNPNDSSFQVINNNHLYQYHLGDEFKPFRYNWYITEITNETIGISWSSRHTLVPFIYSMIKIYSITGNTTYLEQVKPITRALINHQDENGLFIRQIAHESTPVIIGMYNSICIYALYLYYLLTGDKYVYNSISNAARSFFHSSEGTTDHLINSVLGLILSKFILGNYADLIYEENEIRYLLELYEDDGEITYALPSSKKYPYYKPSYWTYDARIFMRVAQFMSTEKIYSKVFPTAFDRASNATNEEIGRVHNLMTLYQAYSLGLHPNDSRFIDWAYGFIESVKDGKFYTTKHALDYILVLSLILSWESKNPFLIGTSNSAIVIENNGFNQKLNIDLKVRLAKFNRNIYMKIYFRNNNHFLFDKIFQINNFSTINDIYSIQSDIDTIPTNISYKIVLLDADGNVYFETNWFEIDSFYYELYNYSFLFIPSIILFVFFLFLCFLYIKKSRIILK